MKTPPQKTEFHKPNMHCFLLCHLIEMLSNEFSTLLCCRGCTNDGQERPRIYSYCFCDFHTNPQGLRAAVAGYFSKLQPHLGNRWCRTQPCAGQGVTTAVLRKLRRCDCSDGLTCSRQTVYNDHFR